MCVFDLADQRLGGAGADGKGGGRIGGLALLPSGAIVFSSLEGQLFKCPLGNAHEFRPIGTPHPFPGADAVMLGPEGHLYLAATDGDRLGTVVWRLTSDDDFESVRVVAVDRHGENDRAVALAVAHHRVWAIDGHPEAFEAFRPDTADYVIAPFSS